MRLAVAAVALVALCWGCGNDAPVGAPPVAVSGDPMMVVPPAPKPQVDVHANDNVFTMDELTVAAGTPVRWVNVGENAHDVVPVDEAARWGASRDLFGPGQVYTYLFDVPGEYRYYCSLHGTPEAGMVGVITVTAE